MTDPKTALTDQLFQAVEEKNSSKVAKLLDEGADIEGTEVRSAFYNGATPLIYSAINDSEEVVKVLIDKGANLEALTKKGETSLILATYFNSIKSVKLLLDAGANVSATDRNGDTPLMVATRDDNTEIIELLTKAGAQK